MGSKKAFETLIKKKTSLSNLTSCNGLKPGCVVSFEADTLAASVKGWVDIGDIDKESCFSFTFDWTLPVSLLETPEAELAEEEVENKIPRNGFPSIIVSMVKPFVKFLVTLAWNVLFPIGVHYSFRWKYCRPETKFSN